MDAKMIVLAVGSVALAIVLFRLAFSFVFNLFKAFIALICLLCIFYVGQSWKIYADGRNQLKQQYRQGLMSREAFETEQKEKSFVKVLKSPKVVILGTLQMINPARDRSRQRDRL